MEASWWERPLCDPMDGSLPGSAAHGIFQARILEWAAISFSRGSSQPRDRTQVSCIAHRRFTVWATRETRLKGKLGLILMGGAMLSKSLIQISVDGQGCIPSLLFDLRPNYGVGNEDNGDLLQKVPCMHCYTQWPQRCSRPLLTHTSARDSWILTGKSGSVFCGVTAPFSWVLVHTRFCLCPPSKSLYPSPV